jgi:predicted dehydrogenase
VVRLGLIGAGKWGKNYIDVAEAAGARVTWACGRNWREAAAGKIDALIIATPPEPRAALIRELAQYGYPMMVEKPLCLSMADAEAIRLSQSHVFLVNYQHLFSPKYDWMRQRLNGICPRVFGVASGPEVRSYSLLWDYGPHFLAMAAGLGAKLEDVMLDLKVSDGKSFRLQAEHDIGHSTVRFFYNGRTERPLVHAVRAFANAVQNRATNDWRFGIEMSLAITRELERRDLRTAGSMGNPTGSEQHA